MQDGFNPMRFGYKPWLTFGLWAFLAAGIAAYLFKHEPYPSVGDAVLLGTAVLIAWYSLETLLLRYLTEEPLEAERTPVLAFNVIDMGRDTAANLGIKNIGKAIAYDIRFEAFSTGEWNYIFNLKQAEDFIEPAAFPGQEGKALDIIVRSDDGRTLMERRYGMLWSQMLNNPIFIVVHYRNVAGDLYHSVYKLSSQIMVVFSPLLQFISAGRGRFTSGANQITFETPRPRIQAINDKQHPSIVLNAYISGKKKPQSAE